MRSLKTFAVICGFSILSAMLCIGIIISKPLLATRLNDLIYDGFMTAEKKRPVHPDIAIVDIDEASLAELGQWPWPRWQIAVLIENLIQSGVKAIGLDILQHEPDASSLTQIGAKIEKNFGIKTDFKNIPEKLLDNDLLYRQTIAGKPVALGAFTGDYETDALPPATGLTAKTPPGAPMPQNTISSANGILAPLPMFYEVAPIGIINASLFSDGVIRKVPLLTRIKDRIYPNLALLVLMLAQNKKVLRLDSDKDGLARLRAGFIKIPVSQDGSFHPIFRGPAHSYPYYSAKDVLNGKTGKKKLEGKVVFVGSSATGLLDIRSTPFDPAMPGVEVHATIADNLLSGESLKIPPWEKGAQIIAVCIAAIISGLSFGFLRAFAYAPIAVILALLCIWGSWNFFENGIFLSPLYVIINIILTGAFIVFFRFWNEERKKLQIKNAFSRYVAPDVVARIIADNGRPLAGEQKEAAVLFTDVRNFTAISEKLSPDQIVKLLNSYFTEMTQCVIMHKGTMDKFIGDALMAFWNAPVNVEEYQLKCVLAAMDMQKALKRNREEFFKEFGINIYMGAGINCGIVHVGNMGSNDLLDYTCIGDTVNLASRLEGLCKKYHADIVVSDPVYKACCNKIYFRHLDRICVKGKNEPADIYTPLENADMKFEELWQNALDAYFKGNFQTALDRFAELKDKSAELFIERCSVFVKTPPDKWEGIWSYKDK